MKNFKIIILQECQLKELFPNFYEKDFGVKKLNIQSFIHYT